MSKLDAIMDQHLAQILQVPVESLTHIFLSELGKKMRADPMYGQGPFNLEAQEIWMQKCRVWAQEVLRDGPTPCS